MKGLGLARLFAHAQTQLGRKAGGQDLPGAVGDGVQQRALPMAGAALLAGGHQHGQQAAQQGFVQRRQPARVEIARQRQHEQLRRIQRFGAGGQQFVAHALGQLAGHGGALGKAEVRQQRGDVHLLRERCPPGLQPHLDVGRAFRRVDQQSHAACGALRGLAVAAHPIQHGDELQVPLCQRCGRVDPGEQLRQVRAAAAQCSTLAAMGWPGWPGEKASSTNSSIGQVNGSPSSATQK